MGDNDQLKSIKKVMTLIEKGFGRGAIMNLGTTDAAIPSDVAVIPTGSPSLDEALGCGGYPKGRVVEIYGPESSGKTTLTLHAMAECQRQGGVAAFIDAEHALDMTYARALGVRGESLLLSQPDHGEQALEICEALVRSEEVDLVVVDSVAALVPRAEIEGDMGDSHMGLQARLMSQALRKLTGAVYKTQATVIFINQLRHKIGVTYGSPETTTGGNALKYYCSVRLDVRRIGAVKSGEEVLGNRTRVKVVKNKMAPPFRSVEFDIRYGVGIDQLGDLMDQALALNVLERSGSHYQFEGERIAQGRENTRKVLMENQGLYERLFGAVTTAAGEKLDVQRRSAVA